MANEAFRKFIEKSKGGAHKKEKIRQEKRKIREESRAYFEQKKKEKRFTGTDGKEPIRTPKPFSRPEKQEIRKPGKSERPLKPDKRDKSDSTPKPALKTGPSRRKSASHEKWKEKKAFSPVPVSSKKTDSPAMPLNKFIAHGGICSRRDAAELVKKGKVTVDGQTVTEPGHKVNGHEDIRLNGKKISLRKNLVYILLNKPKDTITSAEDPQGRKTVLDIVKNATPERVYPVGRLDRNTTGVLLLTNDGDLAQKLSHPSYEVKKIYEVKLDKPLARKDFDQILKGMTLEDGFIAPDSMAYADTRDKSVIGIEIHSGRNRIVRRIFEYLGYEVRSLDRVLFANLSKKNVDRGKWRFLTEKEIRLLKYLNTSFIKK